MKIKMTLLVLTVLALVGCARKANVGDQMLNQSNETKELSENWSYGKGLVDSGVSLQKKGNALIASGKDKINRGNSLISAGNDEIEKGQDMLNEGNEAENHGLSIKHKSETSFVRRYPNTDIIE